MGRRHVYDPQHAMHCKRSVEVRRQVRDTHGHDHLAQGKKDCVLALSCACVLVLPCHHY